MAALRAYINAIGLVGQLDQFFEALRKFRGLHVIRITSKGCISRAQVERIAFGMTQPAQSSACERTSDSVCAGGLAKCSL